jgi:hypothetical protein
MLFCALATLTCAAANNAATSEATIVATGPANAFALSDVIQSDIGLTPIPKTSFFSFYRVAVHAE